MISVFKSVHLMPDLTPRLKAPRRKNSARVITLTAGEAQR
jgi:hypothetical protein